MDPRLDLVGERECLLEAGVPAVVSCGWSEGDAPPEVLVGRFLGDAFLGVPPPLTRAMTKYEPTVGRGKREQKTYHHRVENQL